MAKSKTELLADIAALSALVTIADLQSLFTDIVNSFSTSLNLYSDTTSMSTLTAGANVRTHNLGVSIVTVYVIEGTVVHQPDFVATDSDNTSITWVGADLLPDNILYLGQA